MPLTHYVNFDCRESGDKSEEGEGDFLVAHILTGIHQAIVTECGEDATKQSKIAMCFPQANQDSHGAVIRVFTSDKDVMGRLLRNPAVHRYATSVASEILLVPEQHQYQRVARNRQADRLSPSQKRRDVRRGKSVTMAEVRKNGFIVNVISRTTNQEFPLFITQTPIDQPSDGVFNAYGLSTTATMPMF